MTTTSASRTALLLIASVLLWSGPAEETDATDIGAVKGEVSRNPTLFEVRQQCNEIVAFFPVPLAVARRWVPPAFKLTVDAQQNASAALVLMNCPDLFSLTTPNAPPLQTGTNLAPGAVVHFWFMLEGDSEILPVPGAEVTTPTRYAYALADLVTSPIAARVYRRSGKNAVLVRSTTFADEGKRQAGKIIFTTGSSITVEAYTPTQFARPLRVGGNIWNWHVSRDAEVDDDLAVRECPSTNKSRKLNSTRVMFLATAPGPPNTTQVKIHAEPGTLFADFYGANDVVSERATFFRPNNIVNNSSRGKLAWTIYPPYTLHGPPLLP